MKLKVVSLNVWFNGDLLDRAALYLKQQKADVVLLQEVLDAHGEQYDDKHRSLLTLQRSLAYDYSAYEKMLTYQSPTAGDVPLGTAVLSNMPIRDSFRRFFVRPTLPAYQDIPEHWPLMPRILQHVRLKSVVGELNIFNMHGVWDLDGDNFSPARQKMSQIIISETQYQPNVILAGDSNANASNPAMRAIEQHLKPVFGPELKTTFNMRRKTNPGYATAAVDLMYVSPSIQILAKDCPDVDVSDHLPIVAELEIG